MTVSQHQIRGMKGLRVGLAMGVAALGASAALALTGCQEKEITEVTLTVVATDETHAYLADADATMAQDFLQQAADRFAATYDGLEVTINVVTLDDEGNVVAQSTSTPPAPQSDTAETDATDEPEVPATDDLTVADIASESSTEEVTSTDEATSETAVAATSMKASAADVSATADDASAETPALTGEEALAQADIVFGAYDDLAAYVYDGRAVSLDDIISADMKTYIPANLLNAGVAPSNGKTYLLPFAASQKVLVINGDLFTRAGLTGYVALLPEVEPEAAEGEEATETETTEAEGEGETDEETTTAPIIPADEVAAAALARATVQVWTQDQWEQVLSTLATQLPRIAARTEVEGYTIYPLALMGSGAEGVELAAGLLRATGVTFNDSRGMVNLETPEGIAAATWVMQMAELGAYDGLAADLTEEDCWELFNDGQLAMMLVDVADIPQLYADTVVWDSETSSYVMARTLSFVTLPTANVEVQQPGSDTEETEEDKEAAEDAEAEAAADADAAESDAAEGEGDSADEEPTITVATTAGCVIPVELSGFAVLDNGNDVAVKVAKEFLSYLLNSDEWLAYEAAEGLVPVDGIMYDTYMTRLFFGTDLRAQANGMVTAFELLPLDDDAKAELNAAFAQAVTQRKTPVELTASINKVCNAYIEAAYASNKLHD